MLPTKCNLSWENNPRMYEKCNSIWIKYGVSILKQHLGCLGLCSVQQVKILILLLL